jgi:hypothetical protein
LGALPRYLEGGGLLLDSVGLPEKIVFACCGRELERMIHFDFAVPVQMRLVKQSLCIHFLFALFFVFIPVPDESSYASSSDGVFLSLTVLLLHVQVFFSSLLFVCVNRTCKWRRVSLFFDLPLFSSDHESHSFDKHS